VNDQEWRALALRADSMLSLLRHRGGIKFGTPGLPTEYEVDQVIGQLRRAYEQPPRKEPCRACEIVRAKWAGGSCALHATATPGLV
jgi:hypothetical protein